MKQPCEKKKSSRISGRLSLASEEEGTLSLLEGKEELLRFSVYPVGRYEAELTAQDIGLLSESGNGTNIREIVIQKVRNAVIEAFRVMENEGFPEVVLVEKKGKKFEEILHSTDVVQQKYSEYLMRLPKIRPETTRSCGLPQASLYYEEDGGGYVCRNKENTFSARVSPYRDGWYLYETEVAEGYRKKGIGTACVKALAERFLPLYLQVGSYNQPALQLYDKLGFEVIEEICYYYPKREEG